MSLDWIIGAIAVAGIIWFLYDAWHRDKRDGYR